MNKIKYISCNICKDTHMMTFGQDKMVMCTFCPVPCGKCRQNGNGPYCTKTPCKCECHYSKKEKQQQSVESMANEMAYFVQDLIESFAYGSSFKFEKTERYFLQKLKQAKGTK